jgi:hypothetical protein
VPRRINAVPCGGEVRLGARGAAIADVPAGTSLHKVRGRSAHFGRSANSAMPPVAVTYLSGLRAGALYRPERGTTLAFKVSCRVSGDGSTECRSGVPA